MSGHLESFQKELSTYLRDPENVERPAFASPERSRIYEDLLFNNCCTFLDTCFPVAKKLLNDQTWRKLCRHFYKTWHSESPYFHEIPAEFVAYLNSEKSDSCLPPWLKELAHYEWVELAVDSCDVCVLAHAQNDIAIGCDEKIALNPSVQNLSYEWPVHKISKNFTPEEPCLTYLVVYRDEHHKIQFTEVNAATSYLIGLVSESPLSRQDIVQAISPAFSEMPYETLQGFVNTIIDELLSQKIFSGV